MLADAFERARSRRTQMCHATPAAAISSAASETRRATSSQSIISNLCPEYQTGIAAVFPLQRNALGPK